MNCENCNNEIKIKYGSGRFCCEKCARCFSTKSKRKEINEKVKQKLIGFKRKDRQKFICKKCNQDFYDIRNRIFCSKKCSCSYIGSIAKKDTSKMGGLRDGGGRTKVYEYKNWLGEVMKLNKDEIQVAQIMDLLKLNWKRNWCGFNYTDFKGNKRKYYPDFYLNDYDCYIEYKGWVTKELEHKMNDALKNNKFKLIKIFSNDKRYKKLGLHLQQITKNPNLLLNEIR